MKLNLDPNDYPKVAAVASAVVFLICIVLACSWWNENGFDVNTVIACACAAVCAVFFIVSVWFMARTQRAERMENVDIVLKHVPGVGNKEKESDEPATVYKKPKD